MIIETTFNGLKARIETQLSQIYLRNGQSYDRASPYGQILFVIQQVTQGVLVHIRNSVREQQHFFSNSRPLIYSNAFAAGLNPQLARPAQGRIRFSLRPEVAPEDIPGRRVTVLNGAVLRNRTNGLSYSLDLGGASQSTFTVQNGLEFPIVVKQGIRQLQSFTGTGLNNQSFHVATGPLTQPAQEGIKVRINGSVWTRRKSIRDMVPGENAFYARAGFEEGMDIVFGNSAFGRTVPQGALIEVEYFLTDGQRGNIINPSIDDWTFVTGIVDGQGQSYDPTDDFRIFVDDQIGLGVNAESLETTRNLVPNTSMNFVLATPEQYETALLRQGLFSYVRAWSNDERRDQTGDATIYATLVLDVRKLYGDRFSYFELPMNAFVIDDAEKAIIEERLRSDAVFHIGTRIVLLQPTIVRYALFVFIRYFRGAELDSVRKNVRQVIEEYLFAFSRKDRLPVSDIIDIIEPIPGVDSVSVEWKSEVDERYHREQRDSPDYDPNLSIGIDPTHGDALFKPDQIALVRGGWYDRNGIWYDPEVKDQEGRLSSLNIIFTGESRRNSNA